MNYPNPRFDLLVTPTDLTYIILYMLKTNQVARSVRLSTPTQMISLQLLLIFLANHIIWIPLLNPIDRL
jgi:hypothetical protein